jgi:hypothetical protein
MAHFEAVADLNAGLADRDEVTSFIRTVQRMWQDEEAQAIAAKKRM